MGLIAFALIGGHLGMNSIAGMFYASTMRASGAGWATAVGKIGSILGPVLGGLVLATTLPVRSIFAVVALWPLLMLLTLLTIWRIHRTPRRRR
jgi:AAHS family 4-hydroxybenzoate transporter-like MFS transporter